MSGASETAGHASPMSSRVTSTVLSLFLASSEQLHVRGHAAAFPESPCDSMICLPYRSTGVTVSWAPGLFPGEGKGAGVGAGSKTEVILPLPEDQLQVTLIGGKSSPEGQRCGEGEAWAQLGGGER